MTETKLNGYVYSIWNGIFTCYEGYVDIDKFICSNIKKQYDVAIHEGDIYNALVWFRQRNDEEARDILISYQNNLINKFEQQIENCKHKITLLSKPIILK